ncbi:MAG: diaminopimelate epimerase [Endomicrobium sp.]|jgi:diaminopimelate epimerase|nr:diaminopimelate epimerase [Endomicrobium sp.]
MNINFTKLTAAGNDFIVIDNRTKFIVKDKYNVLAKQLCDRKYSIGADGLILLENSNISNFKMVYFNSDGSHACMCGNGGRAIAKFAYDINIVDQNMNFETDAGIIKASILPNNKVKLYLYDPKNLRQNINILIKNKKIILDFIDTGVPHAVMFVNDIKNVDVFNLGQSIRLHETFNNCNGTNVNFVKVSQDNNDTIFVRTYERGVENETLACGTGVIASSIISVIKGFVNSPVTVITKNNDILKVSFNHNDNIIKAVALEGPAFIVFKGIIKI